MQRLKPDIDTVYVSSPYGFTKLMTKQFSNYKYKKNGILLDSGIKKITRFAKDYNVSGSDFTLLAISLNKSDSVVEKSLDKTAESIKKDNRLKALVANASLAPVSLGVKI